MAMVGREVFHRAQLIYVVKGIGKHLVCATIFLLPLVMQRAGKFTADDSRGSRSRALYIL